MKITVIHHGTTIILDDTDTKDPASMRWEDQNSRIKEYLSLIIKELAKLNNKAL